MPAVAEIVYLLWERHKAGTYRGVWGDGEVDARARVRGQAQGLPLPWRPLIWGQRDGPREVMAVLTLHSARGVTAGRRCRGSPPHRGRPKGPLTTNH